MKLKYIFAASLSIFAFVSCNDAFLDRYPETSISPEAFFKSDADLKLYTNSYYDCISTYFTDYVSDNYGAYSESHTHNDLIRGSITPETVGGWNDWATLRRFNFLLDHADQAEGDETTIAHYVGLTRLQRAVWYYEMVKKYNAVPWYDRALTDTDEDLLYKARDPRSVVVDNIMADLDYAVNNMSESMGNRTIFSKWYALAMQARICLHEASFRKYHDELNLQGTADAYYQKAIEAVSKIMQSGQFAIDKSGGVDNSYHKLFSSEDLSNNSEMILFKDYDRGEQIKHWAGNQAFSWVTNLSRSLMESYEYIDADGNAVPFTSVEGYDTMTYDKVFENRDPRMSQTFMKPGFIRAGAMIPTLPNLRLGGYACVKFETDDPQDQNPANTATDQPVARYAEMLLIYAEAKAELGQLTQDDMDNTVNEIRSRVGMPRIVIAEIMDDPNLTAQYPDVTDKAILQIRRERRIELACENFRWDDIMRWKQGHLIREVQEGIYVDKFGVFDVTGDGVPDVGVFASNDTNTIPEAERSQYVFYYLDEGVIELSEGDHGFIIISNEKGNRKFEEPKNYYLPVPQQQRVLNPQLEETVYWD